MCNVHVISYEPLVVTCDADEMSNFFNIGWGFMFHECLNFIGKWEDGCSTY